MIERLKGYVRDLSQPGTMGRVAAHHARRIPLWLGVGSIFIGVVGCAYVTWWAISGTLPKGWDPTMSRQEYIFSYLGLIGMGVIYGIFGYALIGKEKDPHYNLWEDFVAKARSLILSIRGRRGRSARLGAEGPGANVPKSTSHQHAESIQAEQSSRLRLPQSSQPRVVKMTEQLRESTGLNPEQFSPVADVLSKILDERDRQQRRREIWLLAVGAVLGLVGNMLTVPMGRLFGS
jgi:hypothetical protein